MIYFDEFSVTPKYQQLANCITKAIEDGKLSVADVLPSINEMSFDFEICRDTAEKGYKHLKNSWRNFQERHKNKNRSSFSFNNKGLTLIRLIFIMQVSSFFRLRFSAIICSYSFLAWFHFLNFSNLVINNGNTRLNLANFCPL